MEKINLNDKIGIVIIDVTMNPLKINNVCLQTLLLKKTSA